MPHTAPSTPAGAKYTDTELEPIRDALAALANGDFRTRPRRFSDGSDGPMLADIGSMIDEVATHTQPTATQQQILALLPNGLAPL